ncbi:DMT family transporter [Enterovirga rhinocerotis]|uniref:Putative blue pigment (Indigoidine) exporter n=1 Tax=Enterovirga rhinocerotis TaxID=1339210 RepID=A0A4R7BTJ0_9HYPH|nr:EamA family transporter [Enterovirga rhinocerotis]TDR89040.1 putative blue pigment (indigoidine) exporter [Enterovirga rhinocerotis]
MAGPTLRTAAATAIAPCLWGTTYIVFTTLLPVDHPLLVSALRALPAGLLLMALGAGLPPRHQIGRLALIGFCNIGLFFALIFFAAARLPGGVAATLSSSQPLIVAFLAWPLLGRKPRIAQVAAALCGLVGVAMLVLDPSAHVDLLGALAAFGSALSMACATVLIARWGRLGTAMQVTAWQLALGGLFVLPFALLVEGVPPLPSGQNLLGYAYLGLLGTALAYWLWVRGIGLIGPDAAFLGLLSPVTATLIGAAALGEWLGPLQWCGVAIILGATLAGMWLARQRARGT